jgi:CheY-like chemotaxis protein
MNPTKILLVDDEPTYTEMLGMSLQQFAGYSVRTENDAAKALQAAVDFNPDLILLDVMMPELDGGDVAAQLAAKPGTRNIPVAFLSAMVVPGDPAQSAQVTSPRRYLSKGMNIQDLIQNIEHILGRGASPRVG